MSQTSGSTLLERNLAAASKALEVASMKGRNLGEEVSHLQDVVVGKRDGWKEAQGARGRAEDALKQAKTTWVRADCIDSVLSAIIRDARLDLIQPV